MTYAVFDLETTTRKSYKRLGNPFDPGNFIVAIGWKRKGDAGVSHLYSKTGDHPADWFSSLLAGTVLLVGQNIKYDVLHAIANDDANRAAWLDFIARGGNVWDCQLAEFALNGQLPEEQMISMDELAPRYGGTVKIDEVKKLWEAGVDTPDIPKDLLLEYLCGRTNPDGTVDLGDIGNTEKIFLGQLERARAAGQVKSLLMNMGSMLATIEMECNGMAVDKPYAEGVADKLAAELADLEAGLEKYKPDDMPEELDFKWTNRYHLSPLIFGGKVKYKRWVQHTDANGAPLYAQKDEVHYVLKDGGTLPAHELTLENSANVVRFAGGANKGEMKTKKVKVPDLTKPKGAITEFYHQFPGFTAPKKEWASSTEGLYSVAAEVIEELGNRGIPFLDHLAKVTALSKDLRTYYITTDPKTGEQKGMLTLAQDDARFPHAIIHHRINHTNTVTLRFSSSDPNLQNVPRKDKSIVKTVFVSRFSDPVLLAALRDAVAAMPDDTDEQAKAKAQYMAAARVGGRICQSDFTSLEVYVQAILTQCKQLIADLRLGLDMHCLRVSQTFDMEYTFVVERVKAGDKDMKQKRTDAKSFSFQRAYGAGAQKISDSTGIPIEVVYKLIEAEEERYPEIVEYFEKRANEIAASRKDIGRVVPHPQVRGVMCRLGRGSVRTPDGKLYTYVESPSPEFLVKRGTFQSFSPTEIKNYEVQGGGGEWAKAAMWLAVRAFAKRRNFGMLALLVNQVHDALYGDFHDDVADEASALLHACMLEASTFIEWYFGWEVPVPVPSETMLGVNMMEEHSPESDNWHAMVRAFRLELRAEYIGNHTPSYDTLK